MNLLDIGIIVVLLLAAWRGYYRGFIQEISTIVGLLAGLVVAANYYLRLAKLLQPHLPQPTYNRLVAFFILFILTYWLVRLSSLILQRLSQKLFLGPVDRVLGGLFAVAKGAVVLGFLLSVATLVVSKDNKLLKESRTVPYVKGAYQQVLLLLPADFKGQLQKRFEQFQREWSGKERPAKGEEI